MHRDRDDLQAEADALALEAAAMALRAGQSMLPITASVAVRGVYVTLSVVSEPPHLANLCLTPCARDCIEAVRFADGPISTSRILTWLEASEHVHGESTVKYTLANLVKMGWLRASKVAPRGYSLGVKALGLRSDQSES